MKARTDFLWYSKGDSIKEEDKDNCEVWLREGLIENGDNVIKDPELLEPIEPDELKEEEDVKDELDLNNDGVVDSKDSSIAGKVLAKARHNKKKKNKK